MHLTFDRIYALPPENPDFIGRNLVSGEIKQKTIGNADISENRSRGFESHPVRHKIGLLRHRE